MNKAVMNQAKAVEYLIPDKGPSKVLLLLPFHPQDNFHCSDAVVTVENLR